MLPGSRIEVLLRRIVHGGAVLAGIPGDESRRTVFVRHGLPGERGTAVVTGSRSNGRILFADLVEVADPSPDRVDPPCPVSGPGGCGGCDLQHAALPAQRILKAQVVADALRRTGRLELGPAVWDGAVHPVPGDEVGLRWRTRSRFEAREGSLAMQGRRSHDLIRISDCPIAARAVVEAARAEAAAGAAGEIAAVASSTGDVVAGPAGRLARRTIHEEVAGHRLELPATGFWQVHPGAPAALLAEVAAALRPGPAETLLDLYGGAGLFAVALAGSAGAVHLVEGDRAAADAARRNLRSFGSARVHRGAVERWLAGYRGPADVVVLDPPRSGAGAAVLEHLHRLRPRAAAYVACDPVALARDLRTMVGLGWSVGRLRAFDLFPMTHHIECVALLLPPSGNGGGPA